MWLFISIIVNLPRLQTNNPLRQNNEMVQANARRPKFNIYNSIKSNLLTINMGQK